MTLLTPAIDLTALSFIPGIDQDKVKRYGRQILRLVENARRRYQELTKDAETNGVVPDPNHHNVINLSSSDEYSDVDLFVDQVPDFALQPSIDIPTVDFTSRYFPPPSPGAESADKFESGAKPSSSKGRKRAYTKRPRRKKGGSNGTWQAGASRAKSGSGNYGSSKSSAPRKTGKAKTASSTIGMMPI